MKVSALIEHLNGLLKPEEFRDYAPNGLQVEGRGEVRRIVLGVTASLGLIKAAAERKADMVLVHHGWFWRGEDPRLVGMKGRRVRALLSAGMNLAAYHLPLDAHPEFGNNAELARLLGLTVEARAGELGLLHLGSLIGGPVRVADFADQVERVLGRRPLVLGPREKKVSRIAWCSGAAQDELLEAASLGADLYLSGEVSERTTFEAVESGVTYFAAGHTATEQFGIQALGRHLAQTFPELTVEYVAEENPV